MYPEPCILQLANKKLTAIFMCIQIINFREYRKGQSRETGNIGYTRQRKTKQKQSRETGNIGYTRQRKTKQKHK